MLSLCVQTYFFWHMISAFFYRIIIEKTDKFIKKLYFLFFLENILAFRIRRFQVIYPARDEGKKRTSITALSYLIICFSTWVVMFLL